MAEFTWLPTVGFSTDINPSVNKVQFGEGYSQRVPSGINNIMQSWNVSFNSQSIATANAIDAFLSSKYGTNSFTWIPPGETIEVKVLCPKWTKTYESSISRSISATFERVYE